MWQLLTPFRKRVETRHTPARRPRWYRPHCKSLEDRCLLSVSLTSGGPPVPLVGSPVIWTATASGHGTTPVYQFSVEPSGGTSQVVRDFSPSNSFTWNPMQEGTYNIQVTVKDSFSATTGESASASYTAESRVVGTSAVISPMSNPLVALYSAPPSAGSSMYVQFSPLGPNPSWRNTAQLPIVPGESTNFLVAGMLPNTTYLMRHVLNDGTVSAPLAFTTGSLPTNLTFPTFTVPQPPAPGTDLTQDMVFHVGVGGSAGTVDTVATDLQGNVEWYYDPVANNFPSYATSLVPGGTVLLLGGAVGGAGGRHAARDRPGRRHPARDEHRCHQRRTGRDGAALDHRLQPRRPAPAQRGHGCPGQYSEDHQRQRHPHHSTTADMVLVLDQNFQVAWVWDAFNWLDTNRLPTLGEGPGDWMHANSIAWSPADGDLIVSMRSQDWVIKIDYANGTGDGHVVWRLGQGGDFTINSSDPSPWFSHQHDVRYINDTTILVFDDGNTRRATDPNADSRGQELVLNENTMKATLVVNADLGNYSLALGSCADAPQREP